ncbi:uncharacterized protein DS421_1g04530 [Arachis hypogaea]|nr:uncharacterized protein DS421_1g04530 [Arachis hypogaea]
MLYIQVFLGYKSGTSPTKHTCITLPYSRVNTRTLLNHFLFPKHATHHYERLFFFFLDENHNCHFSSCFSSSSSSFFFSSFSVFLLLFVRVFHLHRRISPPSSFNFATLYIFSSLFDFFLPKRIMRI